MTIVSKAFRSEFETLRSICEDNPAQMLSHPIDLKNKFLHLEEAHYQFFIAYAYIKLMQYSKAETIIRELLVKSVINEDAYLLVHCNLLLSHCYPADLLSRQSCLNLAEEFARKFEDEESLAEVISCQGDFLFYLNNFKEAEEKHLQVQHLLQKIDSPIRKMRSLHCLSNIYRALGKPQKSIQNLQDALNICRRENYAKYELILLNKLALIQIDLSHYQEAESILLKCIELCEKQNLTIQKIQSIFSLGAMYLTMQDPEPAIQRFNECSAIATEVGFSSPLFLLDLKNNYAEAYRLMKALPMAMEYYDAALSLAQEHRISDAIPQIRMGIASIHLREKRYGTAEILLTTSIKEFKKLNAEEDMISAMDDLAKLYLKIRNYPRCVQMMQKIQNSLQTKLKKIKKEDTESTQVQISFSTSSSCSSDLNNTIPTDDYGFVGNSEAHRRVLNAALLAAQYPNTNVIIMGESGTGKEVVAMLIHKNSMRKYQDFIPVNAAAISPNLVESELFGHTKGSFTGAVCDTKGYFLQANKGTLFIDEITEMPLEMQAKLLRALESRKISPVGSSKEIPFDCRIITATNLNVYDQIKTNQFRLDLFHRINTIEIFIPPLRDRIEDIPLIVEHFVRQYAKEFNRHLPQLTNSFYACMQSYDFPGNVRELKNIIERLFILSSRETWDADLLLSVCNVKAKYPESSDDRNSNIANEEEQIKKALIKFNGVQKEAAKFLQISSSTMTRRITKYHLEAYTRKGN